MVVSPTSVVLLSAGTRALLSAGIALPKKSLPVALPMIGYLRPNSTLSMFRTTLISVKLLPAMEPSDQLVADDPTKLVLAGKMALKLTSVAVPPPTFLTRKVTLI